MQVSNEMNTLIKKPYQSLGFRNLARRDFLFLTSFSGEPSKTNSPPLDPPKGLGL